MFTGCSCIVGPGILAWNWISMPWYGWMWNKRRLAPSALTGVPRKMTSGAFLNSTMISVPRFHSALPERR